MVQIHYITKINVEFFFFLFIIKVGLNTRNFKTILKEIYIYGPQKVWAIIAILSCLFIWIRIYKLRNLSFSMEFCIYVFDEIWVSVKNFLFMYFTVLVIYLNSNKNYYHFHYNLGYICHIIFLLCYQTIIYMKVIFVFS